MKNKKPCDCNKPMSTRYFWSHLKSYGVSTDHNHHMVCLYLENLYGDVDGCEYLNSEQETKKGKTKKQLCKNLYFEVNVLIFFLTVFTTQTDIEFMNT